MNKYLSILCLLFSTIAADGALPDSVRQSVLVVPYNRMMHLSDSDIDIAQGSDMDMSAMRESLRNGLITSLNRNFAEVYNVKESSRSFVKDDDGGMDVLYHSLLYESDSIYPLQNPARFAVKDTNTIKDIKKLKKESKYINVQINDQYLIADLSKKYEADYIIFLNEIDIKTHFDDCLNLALKIYRRDIKVHYSIFDKSGKQVYGDVAVAYFDSNSNDVQEIIEKNFPAISNYVIQSFDRAKE
jgi:hypothetical protein